MFTIEFSKYLYYNERELKVLKQMKLYIEIKDICLGNTGNTIVTLGGKDEMKKVILFLLSILCVLSVSGCGKKPLDEDEIVQSFTEDMKSIEINELGEHLFYDLDVNSVEVTQRQTEDRYDTVYCSVSMGNEKYEYYVDYILYYGFYDEGGWILDDYEVNYNEITPVQGLSDEVAEAYLQDYYQEYTLQDSYYDNESHISEHIYLIQEEHLYCTYDGEVTLDFQFIGDGQFGYWHAELYEGALACDWKLNGDWHSDLESTYFSGFFGDPSQYNVDFSVSSFDGYTAHVDAKGTYIEVKSGETEESGTFNDNVEVRYYEEDEKKYLTFTFFCGGRKMYIQIFEDEAFVKQDGHGYDELVKI